MMQSWHSKALFATAGLAMSGLVHASFHLYHIVQIFSDATGNYQYVMLADTTAAPLGDGQQFLHTLGVTLVAAQSPNSNVFPFPNDLPSSATSNSKFLVATQSFADLGVVTPDYIVPANFLFKPAGSVNYGSSTSLVNYSALPTDGRHAIDALGNVVAATPTNFAGQTATCFSVTPITPAGPYDIDGNGAVDPLTDGLLLIRYLFGLRGDSLIAGAVAPCATRNTADQIQTHIAGQIPP